jgi:DNA polymerase I-like protein with 3'-5' exonuclease and polymerase domains
MPYGFGVDYGGRRVFHERWSDELFRQAFSYIPQRTVSDNTKGAGIRIREKIPNIKIVMEAHDSLLFCIPKVRLSEWTPIMKQEMERPISFKNCSLPRRDLVIPCEIEVGNNYQEMSKFKLEQPLIGV